MVIFQKMYRNKAKTRAIALTISNDFWYEKLTCGSCIAQRITWQTRNMKDCRINSFIINKIKITHFRKRK